ncbi:MAG TPA: SCP2 sterol-binding domain-containing protein [Thermodesulfobacteriota bacterium]
MRFETVSAFFERLPAAFRADRADGVSSVFGFDLSGDGGGQWHVAVADCVCSVRQGAAPSPQVIVRCAADDWLAIVNGTLDPGTAFMTGRLRVKGDLGLAFTLKDLFLKG